MDSLKHHLLALRDCRPLWRIAMAISVAAIAYLATTSEPYPIPAASSDKLNHMLAFLELTLVARLAWPGLRVLWLAPALLMFGLLIEAFQAQLPYREFSLLDLLANLAGIVMGLLPWPGFNSLTSAREQT